MADGLYLQHLQGWPALGLRTHFSRGPPGQRRRAWPMRDFRDGPSLFRNSHGPAKAALGVHCWGPRLPPCSRSPPLSFPRGQICITAPKLSLPLTCHSLFSTSSPTLATVPLLIIAMNRCEGTSHCGFDWPFPAGWPSFRLLIKRPRSQC